MWAISDYWLGLSIINAMLLWMIKVISFNGNLKSLLTPWYKFFMAYSPAYTLASLPDKFCNKIWPISEHQWEKNFQTYLIKLSEVAKLISISCLTNFLFTSLWFILIYFIFRCLFCNLITYEKIKLKIIVRLFKRIL